LGSRFTFTVVKNPKFVLQAKNECIKIESTRSGEKIKKASEPLRHKLGGTEGQETSQLEWVYMPHLRWEFSFHLWLWLHTQGLAGR
jgi:hypothetical protein